MPLHFFLLFAYIIIVLCLYKIIQNNNINIVKPMQILGIICFLALGVRLVLAYFGPSFWYDVGCFRAWSDYTVYYGLNNLYSADIFLDYPPGYMYILNLSRNFASLFSIDINGLFYTIILKLPSMLTDIASGFLIYYIAKNEISDTTKNKNIISIFLASCYMFAPAVIYNSSIWGQIDSFYTFFIVLAIYLIYKNKTVFASIIYAFALLTKPQALLFGPVFLFYILQRKSWAEFFKAVATGLSTIFVLALPFTNGLNVLWLLDLYKNTFNGYKYFTVNAYNAYMPFNLNWVGVSGAGEYINYIVIGFTFVLCLWAYFKIENKGKMFYISYIFITVFFTFCTMMHERYVYPAFLLLLISSILLKDKKLFYIFIALQSINYLNIVAVFRNHYNEYTVPNTLSYTLAFIMVAICVYSLYILIKQALAGKKLNFKNINIKLVSVLLVTVFYAFFAFFKLGSTTAPQTFYQNEYAGEWFIMQFEEPTNLNEIYMYFGLGDGNTYPENNERINNNFELLYQNENDVWVSTGVMPESYVFQWQKLDIQDTANSIMVRANDVGQVLYEIICLDDNGEIIRGNIELSRQDMGKNHPYNAVDESHYLPSDTSYYSSMYFDEIYHGRTAYEQINDYYVYETTHPPLGKSIIEIGIRIFGMTPFGWRFMGTLFGVLMVPLMYILANAVLKNHTISLIVSFIFAFDFMHFTQTRIATVDTYVVFFTMLTFLFMYLYSKIPLIKDFSKQLLYLLLSGIFMALTFSVKWNGAYAMLGLAVFFFISLFIKYRKCTDLNLSKKYVLYTIAFCFLAFVFLPILIYFIAFTPVLRGDSFGEIITHFVTYQRNMFNYHFNLEAEHFFASPWYTWIFMLNPIWYAVTRFANGTVSTISAFGNPVVWLLIPAALVICFIKIFKKDSSEKLNLGFILLGYFACLLPWVFITRLTFIYHYFPCVIFGVLAIGYVLKLIYEKLPEDKKWLIYILPILVFIVFLIFFPVISGVPASQNYVDMLELLPTWYFN